MNITYLTKCFKTNTFLGIPSDFPGNGNWNFALILGGKKTLKPFACQACPEKGFRVFLPLTCSLAW